MDKNKGYKAYNKFIGRWKYKRRSNREKNKQKEKIRKKNNLFNQE